MLEPNEIIAFDHASEKDVVATIFKQDSEAGVVWVKINDGNFSVVSFEELLEKNLEENVKKVLSER